MSPFWIKKHDLLGVLWYRFLGGGNVLKTRRVFVFQYFPMVLDHPKPLVSELFFIVVHVFSKPLLGTVFRGSQRRTFRKHLILVPFLIFMIFKKASLDHLFRLKKYLSFPRRRTGSVLVTTLLFTKPQKSSCHWDLMFF